MTERDWAARPGRRAIGAPLSTGTRSGPDDRFAPDADTAGDRTTALIRDVASASLPRPAPRAESSAIQRVVKAQKTGDGASKDLATFKDVSKYFGVKGPALLTELSTRFFATGLFPASFTGNYAKNRELQGELFRMADNLIADSTSVTVVAADAGKPGAAATALWTAISPSVNLQFLNRYPNFKAMNGVGAEDSTAFAGFLEMAAARLIGYQSQIDKEKYDPVTLKKNQLAEAKITELGARVRGLRKDLGVSVDAHEDTAPLMAKVKQLTAEIDRFEKAWELDWRVGNEKIDAEVEKLSGNTTAAATDKVVTIGTHYQAEGGTDDDLEVSDEWKSALACSLYSILALKQSWLGTSEPEELHQILRKSKELAVYDENRVAAKVRLLAGLKPTAVGGGRKVKDYIADTTAAAKNKKPDSVIMDTAGVAHTFAAVWDGAKFVRADEVTSKGDFGAYNNNEILWIWK